MTNTRNEPVTRNRRVYANTLLDFMKVLYGVGIDPERIDFARMDATLNGRVLFHPVIDGRPIFVEPRTIEALQAMVEAIKVYRGMVMRKGSVRGITDVPPSFLNPSPLQANAEVLANATYDANDNVRSLREHIKAAYAQPIKEAVKAHESGPVVDATTHSKNPNRVAAGRVNALKRWELNRERRRK